MRVDEPGVVRAGADRGRGDQRAQKGKVGLWPDDDRAAQRILEPVERRFPRSTVGDELGDHRIVVGRDAVARLDPGIDPHALGKFQRANKARRGEKAAFRIFGAKPRLDCPAARGNFLLPEGQRLAGGDTQLPLDEIKVQDRLGDRVLDLQPRVHLEEIETIEAESVRRIDDELDGAGADVADGLGRLHCGGAHRVARLLGQAGRKTLFDDFLVAPL